MKLGERLDMNAVVTLMGTSLLALNVFFTSAAALRILAMALRYQAAWTETLVHNMESIVIA